MAKYAVIKQNYEFRRAYGRGKSFVSPYLIVGDHKAGVLFALFGEEFQFKASEFLTLCDQLGILGAAEGAHAGEKAERFQQVGLSLTVLTADNVDALGKFNGLGGEIAVILGR